MKKSNQTHITVASVSPVSSPGLRNPITYFTSSNLNRGMVVMIPIRNKNVPAVIHEITDVSKIKSELRSADFSLKKIALNSERILFSDRFVDACESTAKSHICTIGAVINEHIPQFIMDSNWTMEKTPITQTGKTFEVEAVQAETDDRYAYYKSVARELFANKKSLLVLCPTIQKAITLKNFFSRGIERYVFMLHSKMKENEQFEVWQNILREEHPSVIIMTPNFMSIPRADIGAIIIEEEGSSVYKREKRPHIDLRISARQYAVALNIKLILGDTILRPETIHEEKQGRANAPLPLRFRHVAHAKRELISMRGEYSKEKFEHIISPELKSAIEETISSGQNVFLFASRLGIASMTVCNDCGKTRVCPSCGATLILHEKKKERFFACHACGHKEEAKDECPECGGMRLTMLGITADKIEEAVRSLFPSIPLYVITRETGGDKETEKRIAEFYGTNGAILIGTERAASYLNKRVSLISAVSLDALFAIPDFRMSERASRIIIALDMRAENNFILQTRRKDTKLMEDLLSGNISEFMNKTLEMRKALSYPPFTDLLLIRVTAPKKQAVAMMQDISQKIKAEIDVFPSFLPAPNGNVTISALMRFKENTWPDEEAYALLRNLPPNVDIDAYPSKIS